MRSFLLILLCLIASNLYAQVDVPVLEPSEIIMLPNTNLEECHRVEHKASTDYNSLSELEKALRGMRAPLTREGKDAICALRVRDIDGGCRRDMAWLCQA